MQSDSANPTYEKAKTLQIIFQPTDKRPSALCTATTPKENEIGYHSFRSVRRQILHAAAPAGNPVRLNEPLAVLIQKLVRGADGAVGDAGHGANVARALGAAEQVARHVDAGGRNGERRAACQVANGADLLREALRYLDVLRRIETKLRAEAQHEVDCVCGRRRLVRVGLGEGALTRHAG